MNGSTNDIESHIDLFIENVKRSAARAMEDRGNDGWLTNENLVHSIVKRSRSGMSSSDDGTVQSSEQMNPEDNKKAAGDILRSLLSAPKMQSPQVVELGNWHQLDGTCQTGESYQCQEQIILQIAPNEGDKKRFVPNDENVIHRIPITFLTSNQGNLTFAANARTVVPKPSDTFHVRRDSIPETSQYCTIDENEANLIINEPQKIVLVQDASSNIPERELNDLKVFTFARSTEHPVARTSCHFVQTENKNTLPFNSGCQSVGCQSEMDDRLSETIAELVPKDRMTGEKSAELNDGLFTEIKKMDDVEEASSVSKPRIKKKILGGKKNIKKRKNSKLKRKLKAGGKPLLKKRKKNLAGLECERGEDNPNGKKSKRAYFELTKLEDSVEQVIERFKTGCECSGSNCFDGLNPESVFKHRLNLADLTKAEHDMYLMGVIVSIQNREETSRRKERIRIRSCYSYMGRRVCLTAFLYLQHVTLYQIKRLRSHIKNHGVSPRIHGNHGRAPANTLSLDIYRRATNFVQNYIEKHCIKSVPNFTTFSSNKIGSNSISNVSLHESKPGKKGFKVKIANKMTSYYLPSECTKKIVHKEYKIFCESLKPSQKVMKYSTFTNFLNKQFPNVKFQKVDKKLEDKSNSSKQEEGKNGPEMDFENSGTDMPATVLYIPTKPVHISHPTTTTTTTATLLMTPKQNPETYKVPRLVGSSVENSQIVVNGQHLQFYSGGSGNEFQTDFRFPNQVLVGNHIYSTQCVSQTSGTSQQIYAVDKIV